MGYLVQYLQLEDDVTINATTTIGTIKIRAKNQDKVLLIYSGLVKIADTNNRGRLGITEFAGGSSTTCQVSTVNTSDFHSLAGGFIVQADEDNDFFVTIEASTIV